MENDSDPSNSNESSSSSTSDEDYCPSPPKEKKSSITFLESLSKHIPLEEKHPEAKEYFLRSAFKTKTKKEKLAQHLFSIFDRDVFSAKVKNVRFLLELSNRHFVCSVSREGGRSCGVDV